MARGSLMTILHVLLDDAGDGSGGGAGGASGAPGSTATGSAGSSGASGSPTGAASTGSNTPDRGMIADLQRERQARQRFEAEVAKYKGELETERKRIQSLVGITPKTPAEENDAAIRARIEQLYPGLAQLTPEDIAALRETRTKATQFEETSKHYWNQQAERIISAAEKHIADELGDTKLTPRQVRSVRQAYAAEAESNPEFLKRHAAGDPTLAKEFADQWLEDWYKPAQRRATQRTLESQRRVPFGKDRSIPGPGDKKIDVTDPKAVEDLLVQGFRDRGGNFGR